MMVNTCTNLCAVDSDTPCVDIYLAWVKQICNKQKETKEVKVGY